MFFTCHKDQVKDLHFDKRQENTICWENEDDSANRLHQRIEAVIACWGTYLTD